MPNTPVVEAKPWWKSKTLKANAAAALTAVAAVVTGQIEWQTAIAPIAMSLMNFILRIVTKQPLE